MKTIVCSDPDDLAERAALHLIKTVNAKPDLTLCLPTGKSPQLIYKKLVAAYERKKVSFTAVNLFNLDEYVGMAEDDPASFRTYMKHHLLNLIDLPISQWDIPDGNAEDLEQEAARFDQAIETSGGFDCILLGVGTNGHIGFNEPGTSIGSRTHIAALSNATLDANADDLAVTDKTPSTGITIGIANILEAREVILVASGSSKALAIDSLLGDGSAFAWPVAALKNHPNLTVYLDNDAAATRISQAGGQSKLEKSF